MAIYYSKKQKGLYFIENGMGELVVHGKGSIRSEDTVTWNPDETWKEAVTEVTVCDRILEIYGGVLEQFPNVRKLNLPKSIRYIEMTDRLKALLCTNDVIVHAAYGSCGDAFAREQGLRFLPENIELGWYRDEAHDESTKLVLRFYEDGSRDILYDIFTSGISAGASGGASLDRPMPKEYYPGCTLDAFADMFPALYHEQIRNNPEVKVFLQREAEQTEQYIKAQKGEI